MKKIISYIIVLGCAIMLGGCGKSEQLAEEQQEIQEEHILENQSKEASENVNESVQDEDIKVHETELLEMNENMELYENSSWTLGNFTEGLAWIEITDEEGKNRIFLINKSGCILYEDTKKDSGWWNWSDVKDGYSYNVNRVIDTNGKTLLELEDNRRILAAGEGLFLVHVDESGFDSIGESIEVLTADGECIFSSGGVFVNGTPSGNSYENYRYCGEGIFVADDSGPYNYGTIYTCIFYPEMSMYSEWEGQIAGDFVNGNSILYTHHRKKGLQAYVYNEGSVGDELLVTSEGNVARGRENRIFIRSLLYDMEGNLIKDLSQYKVMANSFNQGYSVCLMTGLDGEQYFSTVDSNGDFTFEPQRTDVKSDEYVSQVWNETFVMGDASYNIKGELLFDYKEELEGTVWDFTDGVAIVEIKDKTYYMDVYGNLLLSNLSMNVDLSAENEQIHGRWENKNASSVAEQYIIYLYEDMSAEFVGARESYDGEFVVSEDGEITAEFGGKEIYNNATGEYENSDCSVRVEGKVEGEKMECLVNFGDENWMEFTFTLDN